MAFSTTPIVTPQMNSTSSSALMPTGTKVTLSDGNTAQYVRATSAISQYAAVAVYANGSAQSMNTTLAASVKTIGFAQTSIASAYYGWVHLGGGPVNVALAANCAASVPLYTTATAGVLDDATVTGGLALGLVATSAVVTAGAATCIAAGACVIGSGATNTVTP